MDRKGPIRKKALQARDAMSEEERREKSGLIMNRFMRTPCYQEAEALLVYVDYKSEVETTGLIGCALNAGKKVYCPKVEGEEMEFYRIGDMSELVSGYRGIREPEGIGEKRFEQAMLSADKKAVMIMPGSAFDRERNRIGYGKGYYDKYIERHPGLYTVAVCFACQLQEQVPSDKYDRKPRILMTEWEDYE